MLHQIDLSRIDLNLFVLFEAVLQERHVGRAAERLALSPSAVSHGLGRLRRLLDDPVFIRTPRGVSPTERALELAAPIEDLLAKARDVIAAATPFDAATSVRTFTLGAPDGVTGVFLGPLLARLRQDAPGIDLRMRQVLPPSAGRVGADAWDGVFTALDARELDLALGPFAAVPARFAQQTLWLEDFVIVSRPDHPFAATPDLIVYCAAAHLVVSQTGDGRGFVDIALAEQGLSRRVALTVPAFAAALPIVAESDLLAAVPRSLASAQGAAARVVFREPPLALPTFEIRCVAPKPALSDAGLAWLWQTLAAR
jgi:DNA-binding transcriptional LysR family regulator